MKKVARVKALFCLVSVRTLRLHWRIIDSLAASVPPKDVLGDDKYPLPFIRRKSQGYCRRVKESVKLSIFMYLRKTIFSF